MANAVVIRDVTISFLTRGRADVVLRECSLDVPGGTAVAVVGESGSGKSTLARALLGDIAANGRVESGTITVNGTDVLALAPTKLRDLRRNVIGYVPQNPGSSLNPVRRIGSQIREVLAAARGSDIAALLDRVQLPPSTARKYPHQLSGGQQQRVAFALAFANAPSVLVLDEPTTGLDVRVQAEVLKLVRSRVDDGLTVIYVTHDLAAATEVADAVAVLYAGEIVESGALRRVYARPRHPYTSALLDAIPTIHQTSTLAGIPGSMMPPQDRGARCVFSDRCKHVRVVCTLERPPLTGTGDGGTVRCVRADELVLPGIGSSAASGDRSSPSPDPVLRVDALSVSYDGRGRVVSDVSLEVARGETFALVGESGSGKTTIARAIAGLVRPTEGEIVLDGKNLAPLARNRRRDDLRRIQYLFQNPALALNPRHTISRIIMRPLEIFFDLTAGARHDRVAQLVDLVRLRPNVLDMYPRALSGGEQQRVALARALAAQPAVIVCDEIVSALDVSVQAAVIDLLADLQDETGTSYLFISHDLGVVRSIAHRTAVITAGSVVEIGPTDDLFSRPRHQYTTMLLDHAPDPLTALQEA